MTDVSRAALGKLTARAVDGSWCCSPLERQQTRKAMPPTSLACTQQEGYGLGEAGTGHEEQGHRRREVRATGVGQANGGASSAQRGGVSTGAST